MKNRCIILDDIENFENLSDTEKYDIAVRQIAEKAPLRICPEEKVCGAATLGDAVFHIVPAKYKDNIVFGSVSHLTLRYDKVLNQGLDAYVQDIAVRLEDERLTASQIEFLHSLQNVIESIRVWHGR